MWEMSERNSFTSCLLIIGIVSSSCERKKIQFAAPQDKKFILGCCGFSLVCGFKLCLSFLQSANREGGGSEIQFTNKMESQHRCQEWKIVSIDKRKKFVNVGLWWFWQMGFCLCQCVKTDMQGLDWYPWIVCSIVFVFCCCFLGVGACLKILQPSNTTGWRDERNNWCVACA